MYYVNPSEVMRLFKAYLSEYGDMISKETAIDELQDALDSVDFKYIDEDDDEQ